MDFRVPELGEGVYEAELVSWRVKVGEPVKRGQIIMEVLTDKATMEVPAPFSGTITGLKVEPGQILKVGQIILSYTPTGQAEETSTAPEARKAETAAPKKAKAAPREPVAAGAGLKSNNGPAVPPSIPELPVKAAPSVRYMARKLGIDLTRLRGTGPQGRILIGDLTPHLTRPAGESQPAPTEPRPDYGTPGARIPMKGVRRRIAEHMVQSKRAVPHYTYVDECDVTDLVRIRESVKEPFARAGVKITFLAFFVKAVAAALKEVPLVNSSLDEEAGDIVLHDHYHIGIAVATPSGLIVPVVHDADRKDLVQIAREVERLSADARAGRVKLEDLRGGTFTITSIGNIGGLFSTPIINHPQVAILGIGKVVKRPVYDAAGNIKPAEMVYLSLSFDHRVLDGAVGAAFTNALMKRLQSPAELLLPAELAGT
jgi:pyruvate dehydrogenase E2 component (dihydrolipoamide acetyltransferase)/2-oxoisovalerate dehydrogenase E2 component (dihydrolipoyl transacylase)